MYSKAGRASIEMFAALQHGPELFEPKGKRSDSPNSFHLNQKKDRLAELVAKQFEQSEFLNDLAGTLKTGSPTSKISQRSQSPTKNKNDTRKFEPFSSMISRESREKTLSPKKTKSNAAYYQPKYDFVDKRILTGVDYSKSPTKRLFDGLMAAEEARNSTPIADLSRPAIPQKPFIRIKGPLPLNRQSVRPDFVDEIIKRKVSQTDTLPNPELPSVLSSVHHLPNIKLSKSPPRKDLVVETATTYCPLYTPNFEYVKKSLGRVGAELSKVVGRKSVERTPYYSYETIYDYDEYVTKNNSHIYPRIRSPSFQKMAPRNKQPSEKHLQSFNSRISDLATSPKNESLLIKSHIKVRNITSNLDTSLFGNAINIHA